MTALLTDDSYNLEPGLALTLARRRHATIRCINGVLWLTRQGSAADIILTAGEGYAIGRSKNVVVQALGGRARFSISPAAGRLESLGARWRNTWRQLCRAPGKPEVQA